jgi:hypothetical protein
MFRLFSFVWKQSINQDFKVGKAYLIAYLNNSLTHRTSKDAVSIIAVFANAVFIIFPVRGRFDM